MTKFKRLNRIPTGIAGLDRLLGGGLFESGVYIVQGSAGAGKTIFANQICFHQAANQRQAIYYTLLTEAHDRMLGFLQGLAFVDPVQVSKGVKYVSGFKVLQAEGLIGMVRNIRDTLAQERTALIVVDGFVTAEEVAPSTTDLKKCLHELQSIAAMFNCTMLLLTNTEKEQPLHAEHTMVDGIFELGHQTVRLKPTRTLEVAKFRGAAQLGGKHTVVINDDGISVYPRIELILRSPTDMGRPQRENRRPFGIPVLDHAIGGGLIPSSNTMLMGPSGVGKTVLGMHFLNAGAAAGEKGVLFSFFERPAEIVEKARRLGMEPLVRAIDSGAVEIVWESSVEANVDIVVASLVSTFERLQPRRVVIDGMHGFQVTEDHPERIQDFFAALADFFMTRGTTLVFTAESQDIVGDPIRPPFVNASRMCQNLLVLRFTEVGGHLARAIVVVKTRDADFDNGIRKFTITARGIEVEEAIEGRDGLLIGQPRSCYG
ncbi:MAG TPA: ATPase domain-containing protein [Kofleriaceae bacterium]|nr:ATPase domain-containing protein [Kofleriaceae bacterium]